MNFLRRRVPSATISLQMTRRAILQRYRGSFLGLAWAFLTPISMLIVYTFIFTKVFTVRWGADVSADSVGDLGTFQFAVLLFAGLSLYAFFSEIVLTTGTAITDNGNLVKKVIFPLRILPIINIFSALFQLLVSLLILVLFQLILTGFLPWTALLSPLAILPLVVLVAGLGWWLSALGTYIRDINQLLTPLVTALLFLGPILYPLSSFSEGVRPWLSLNPLTIPIEAFRDMMIWGVWPDWTALGLYMIAAILLAVTGWMGFTRLRPGFADVL